jgi:hypothetical protein
MSRRSARTGKRLAASAAGLRALDARQLAGVAGGMIIHGSESSIIFWRPGDPSLGGPDTVSNPEELPSGR